MYQEAGISREEIFDRAAQIRLAPGACPAVPMSS
jgi:hypothetical protein